jgi:hypothetical protein
VLLEFAPNHLFAGRAHTTQPITVHKGIASFSKNDASLTAMPMNPLDILEVLVDSKGAARSQPFNHYLTGRKDNADSHLTRTTDPALVLITPKLKHSQAGMCCFHYRLFSCHADPPIFAQQNVRQLRFASTASALRTTAVGDTALEKTHLMALT